MQPLTPDLHQVAHGQDCSRSRGSRPEYTLSITASISLCFGATAKVDPGCDKLMKDAQKNIKSVALEVIALTENVTPGIRQIDEACALLTEAARFGSGEASGEQDGLQGLEDSVQALKHHVDDVADTDPSSLGDKALELAESESHHLCVYAVLVEGPRYVVYGVRCIIQDGSDQAVESSLYSNPMHAASCQQHDGIMRELNQGNQRQRNGR